MKIFFLVIFLTFSTFADSKQDEFEFLSINQKINKARFVLNHSKNIDENVRNNLLDIIESGNYLTNWINEINQERSDSNKIKLTSKAKGGIPYSSPMQTNETILSARYKELIEQNNFVAENLKSKTLPYPKLDTNNDEIFIKLAIPFEKLLNHTVRFSTQLKDLSHYIGMKMYDVRGFLFFKEDQTRTLKLKSFSTLSIADQELYRFYLINLCQSSEFSQKECEDIFRKNLKYNTLYSMYQKHLKDGESFYNLFFRISNPRSDVVLIKENTLESHFLKTNPKVDLWLKNAVENSWKNNVFQLNIVFHDQNSSNSDYPHIEFKKNVWAHVNEVGGNKITMDPSLDLNEERMLSTISHEYGHILGFVDCYLEFYDTNSQTMIYYELDTENIMCSQNGHFLPIHQDLLNQKYKETSWK